MSCGSLSSLVDRYGKDWACLDHPSDGELAGDAACGDTGDTGAAPELASAKALSVSTGAAEDVISGIAKALSASTGAAKDRPSSRAASPATIHRPLPASPSRMPARLSDWTPEHVARWAASTPLPPAVAARLREHEVNGPVLDSLSETDLASLGIDKFGWRRQLLLSLTELRSELSARERALPEAELFRIHSSAGTPAGTPLDSPRHSNVTNSPVKVLTASAKPSPREPCTPPQGVGTWDVPPLQLLRSNATTPLPRSPAELMSSPPTSGRRAPTPAGRFAASPPRQRISIVQQGPTRSGSRTSFRVRSPSAVTPRPPVATVVASPAPRSSPRVAIRSPSPTAPARQLGVVRGTIVCGVSVKRGAVEAVVVEPISVLRWTSPESPRSLTTSGSSKGLAASPPPPPPQAVIVRGGAVSPRRPSRASSPPPVSASPAHRHARASSPPPSSSPSVTGTTCRSAWSSPRHSLRPPVTCSAARSPLGGS